MREKRKWERVAIDTTFNGGGGGGGLNFKFVRPSFKKALIVGVKKKLP
jgi:hypothetical protein